MQLREDGKLYGLTGYEWKSPELQAECTIFSSQKEYHGFELRWLRRERLQPITEPGNVNIVQSHIKNDLEWCRCGIYGVWDTSLLSQFWMSSRLDTCHVIAAAMAWGTVAVYDLGWKASNVKLEKLWLPRRHPMNSCDGIDVMGLPVESLHDPITVLPICTSP